MKTRVWPLPAFRGRRASGLEPVTPHPRGVDLAYSRLAASDMSTSCPPHSPNGTATHFMPDKVPVFAADDGVITYAGPLSSGYAVVIDHRDGFATYYSSLGQLASICAEALPIREQRVRAGEIIGIVGSVSPRGFKHLHFELWRRGEDNLFAPVDASGGMAAWRVLPWCDDLRFIEPAAAEHAA